MPEVDAYAYPRRGHNGCLNHRKNSVSLSCSAPSCGMSELIIYLCTPLIITVGRDSNLGFTIDLTSIGISISTHRCVHYETESVPKNLLYVPVPFHENPR